MSKRSAGVWKAARAVAEPPVPQCPEGLSEPQLAALLFTKDCTICSKKVPGDAWWILQLRLCKACAYSQLISGKALARQFPYLEDIEGMLELVPRECSWSSGRISTTPLHNHCRFDDICRVAEVVEDRQLRLQAKLEDGSAEFVQFVQKCKSEVTSRCEYAKVLVQWARQVADEQRRVDGEKMEARKQAANGVTDEIIKRIVEKLVGLGYEERDHEGPDIRESVKPEAFKAFVLRRTLTSDVFMTDWERMQPLAERLVQYQQFSRLEREEGQVQKARRAAFTERYKNFKTSHADLSVDALMPSDKVVISLPAFRATLDAEGTEITSGIFDEAFNELPSYLEEWKKEKRVDLAKAILKARPESEPADADPEAAVEQGLLSLATSVFATCGLGGSLNHDSETIHWADSIGDHFARNAYHIPSRRIKTRFPEMKCVHVAPQWVEHVKLLVQAVGLDPETATIGDMDALNARFYCDGCSCTNLKDEPVARNWRNGIKHLGYHKKGSPWKSWTLLSPEQREVIAALEEEMTTKSNLSSTHWDTRGKLSLSEDTGPVVGRGAVVIIDGEI
ncbi:hypothetical protein FRB90_001889 [Tulasnella sp. 427]|nr:hypothetical protein FRB90_001889 [Tulasnella sp. 427]